MWEEVLRATTDQTTATGLSLSFLENLSAEVIGVVFGVIISFLIAAALDKLGNNRQFKPLRQRAAQRLAQLHEKMHDELNRPFARGEDNGTSVKLALEELGDIVEEYDFGLTSRQISAVEAYRMRLRSLERVATKAKHRSPALVRELHNASRGLRPALKVLNSGRLEHHWKEVLERDLEFAQRSPAQALNVADLRAKTAGAKAHAAEQ